LLLWQRRFIFSAEHEMNFNTAQLTIRPAFADDYGDLARLAALDSVPAVPPRPLLIAEVDGTLRAALSLRDGSQISDPFFPSARLVALLRAHASGAGATAPRPRLRFRPAYARG
jgi:hypothetical protein